MPATRPCPIVVAFMLGAAAFAAGAQGNPVARFAPPPPALMNGVWNGVDLESRSHCATPQNNGNRGTYAQFDVFTDGAGTFTIEQSGITGLNCTYAGRFRVIDAALAATGTLSCSDGKRGDFRTTSIAVNAVSLDIRMAIQLTSGERCAIDAVVSMARLPP